MKMHVMDVTGHSTFEVDKASRVSMEEAEKRFKELTGRGFVAAERGKEGELKHVRNFDPNAEEIIFHPQLKGG